MAQRWDGRDYQRRFDELASAGQNVHGEADFVMELAPRFVLDAGCGTGRVAIELARRGVSVVGVDASASMIATARELAPELAWIERDLAEFDFGMAFDVVVMAGNVPLFTSPGTEEAMVRGCARHVAPSGALVAGFQLDGRYPLAAYDEHCAAGGLSLTERFATWDRAPFTKASDYAVSVHRLLVTSAGPS
ncbi:MAG TPA: class I SAM-dependent methyltransferase [Acidimicrobiales bacterium]|nr:class I SAM-dependent methyltransferase [Acidimicrobiales bacterium]